MKRFIATQIGFVAGGYITYLFGSDIDSIVSNHIAMTTGYLCLYLQMRLLNNPLILNK